MKIIFMATPEFAASEDQKKRSLNKLKNLNPDLICVASYRNILLIVGDVEHDWS
jgi:methionyl-tRNA formyltransferase